MLSKIALLWDYQQSDMEALKFEREISTSPKRQKLRKDRDFLLNQKNVIEKIESDVFQMSDRLENVKGALALLEEQFKALQQKFEEKQPDEQEEAREFLSEVRKLAKSIVEYEKELKQIQKKANDREKQEHDVRIRAARVKQEFNELKDTYQPEYEKQLEELKQMKDKASAKAKLVDADLLKKYNEIKPHAMPPLVKLIGDQCSGCNMSLPSVQMREFDSEAYLECSNCGRLIVKE